MTVSFNFIKEKLGKYKLPSFSSFTNKNIIYIMEIKL